MEETVTICNHLPDISKMVAIIAKTIAIIAIIIAIIATGDNLSPDRHKKNPPRSEDRYRIRATLHSVKTDN